MFAPELSIARWRKSSRSTNVSHCVEVALTGPAVAVRATPDTPPAAP